MAQQGLRGQVQVDWGWPASMGESGWLAMGNRCVSWHLAWARPRWAVMLSQVSAFVVCQMPASKRLAWACATA